MVFLLGDRQFLGRMSERRSGVYERGGTLENVKAGGILENVKQTKVFDLRLKLWRRTELAHCKFLLFRGT